VRLIYGQQALSKIVIRFGDTTLKWKKLTKWDLNLKRIRKLNDVSEEPVNKRL